MAYPLSPSGHPGHPSNRPNSPPAPAAPPSKRDKRRNALAEKYYDLTDTFTNSRDYQFRTTVHELQGEMALIAGAEVGSSNLTADDEKDKENDGGLALAPLGDTPADINARIQAMVKAGQIAGDGGLPSGRWYAGFVQEVNREREEREAGLVELMNRHRNSLQRIQEERDFRRQLAVEEHKKLSETIRERLVQAISSRKNRLMKDKEHLDLADTSALLLHPNQFSITNPASPGGMHGNRKTRGTRRGADFDDFGGISELHRRKRRALDEDYGSPARDGGLSTPAERNKLRLATQQNAPAYSISSLFTEKELAMHSNTAHVAAVHFLAAEKRKRQAAAAAATSSASTDRDDASDTSHADETPVAPEMERTASQHTSHHATRSTRGNGGATSGLTLLGELAEKSATRPNLPYYILGNYHSRPNGTVSAPTPPGLMPEEIEEDLARFAAARNKPRGWTDAKLLAEIVADIRGREGGRFGVGGLHPDFPAGMDVRMVKESRK